MEKLSRYNIRIPLSENSDILYNARSDRFVAIRHNIQLNNLSDITETVKELLRRNNMLISEDIDEQREVINQWIETVSANDTFLLTINPTLRCNFRCWYCYENHDNAPIMTDTALERVKSIIDTLLADTNILRISFFGGEPLLEYSRIVAPLISYANDAAKMHNKKVSFSFTTNAFLLTAEMIQTLSTQGVDFMQITLDGGKNSHNKTRVSHTKNSFDTIIANIQQLLDSKIQVTLRINVTPENVADCTDILSWIAQLTEVQKRRLTVNVQQVWQTSGTADITNHIDNLLDSICVLGVYAYPAISDNLRSMCYADKANTMVINSDGNIFKCTALDFDTAECESNIFSDSISTDLYSRFTARIKKRFVNKACRECAIFPLCLGGCCKAIDTQPDADYCPYEHNQKEKENLVLTIIKDRIRRDMVSNNN